MKIDLDWEGKMRFVARRDEHRVALDARPPLGDDAGLAPKELLLAAVASCTAMDVAALLRKARQTPERFSVEASAEVSSGRHPRVFTSCHLVFRLEGPLDAEAVVGAVRASQTVFCGVSAMLSRAVPITWAVELGGQAVGSGQAEFELD